MVHVVRASFKPTAQVEWWHNFQITKQGPSIFQKFLPTAQFNVGLLEMALLAELKGPNIDYAPGRNKRSKKRPAYNLGVWMYFFGRFGKWRG